MYTATMDYSFHPDRQEEACRIWEEEILTHARTQEGFVRLQLLSGERGRVMAIGTWENKDAAEAFMRTGVFVKLMDRIGSMTTGDPRPRIWELRSYADRYGR